VSVNGIGIFGFEIEFGVFLVEGNPNLTFILFIALTLLAVLGSRFAYYARRNRARTDIAIQTPIWQHLTYIGVLAALYSLVGLLEIVSSLSFDAKNGLILATTLVLAFAVRQIHYLASGGSEGRQSGLFERVTRAVFVAAIFVYVLAVTLAGQTVWSAALEGISALGFVAYGIAYFHDQASSARLQGTMLDSLLRHLLPILTFASLISVVALAVPFGLARIVVLHVQVVFVIMTATAMMTATIKLRQHLAGL